MSREFELIDVCHSIEDGMITYKGLPAPVISDYLRREDSHTRYAPGTEFHIGRIEMVANTGTYLDTPFHRYARGKDLAQVDLYAVANLDGLVIRCADLRDIDETRFRDFEINGKAILLHTGWDKHWRTEEYSSGNHPYLTAGGATWLAKNGAALVGIDSFNIDSTADGTRPAHTILLGHDIPIVEHLCGLGDLPDSNFKFFAVPVKVKRFGTFPVRAFGLVAR
ncbi:MAG TPA: cyclase family protein [Pyrinomonadaceae bacterium]|nr:cyclase family protein [Pyrinomonadaceae bacterium]